MGLLDDNRPLVLVADPASASAALIASQLEWAGYETITASCGAEAVELIDRLGPAGCVLEVMLGDGPTGYEIVRRMRAKPETALTPTVLMSARAGKLDRDFAFTVGANDYFKKPFQCGDLVARVATLVPASAPVVDISARRARVSHRPLAVAGR